MRFKLEQYHHNVPDADLIADLKRVAAESGDNWVTTTSQNERGKFHSRTIAKRFGSWFGALEKAGLEKAALGPKRVTDEELIADLQRVATELNSKSVTRQDQDERGEHHSGTFTKRFGTWANALQRGGLEMTCAHPKRFSDEDLFKNLEEVWTRLGRQPRIEELTKPFSTYSSGTYAKRFGGWRGALEAFVNIVNKEETTLSVTSNKFVEIEPTRPKETTTSHSGIIGCAAVKQIVTSPVKTVTTEPLARRKTTRTINWRLRFVVMRRDNFRCKCCGRSPATDPTIVLHVDHVLAWNKSGETTIENLQTLCSVCNIGKSDLDFTTAPSIEVENVEL